MAVVEFDAVDVVPAAGAALLTHLRELADDRHGAAMGARERLETIRENRARLQGTINSTRNLRGYQDAEHLAKLEGELKRIDGKFRKANDAYMERSARWTGSNGSWTVLRHTSATFPHRCHQGVHRSSTKTQRQSGRLDRVLSHARRINPCRMIAVETRRCHRPIRCNGRLRRSMSWRRAASRSSNLMVRSNGR